MEIKTSPAFRVVWQGAKVDYLVQADGAAELRVPEQDLQVCGGAKVPLHARLSEVKTTNHGVQARVQVDTRDSAFAFGSMQLEARDAAGAVVQKPFGTIMTIPAAVLGTSAIVGALALAAAVMAIRRGGGIGWTLGIFAALVALAGLGFVGFVVLGRFTGIPPALASAGR